MVTTATQPPTGMLVLQQQLKSSPYWPLRQLVCDTDCNQVLLRGTVSCFYLRQVAETLAAKAVGIEHFRSSIFVATE